MAKLQDPLLGDNIEFSRMKWAICVAFVGIAILVNATPQSNAKATSSSKKTTSKGSRAAATGKKRRTRRAAGPSYQTHPDAERYQQIQQALADRGYFKGEVNGQWGDDSVEALKRFQADQKLDNDGKINSLTLIGLGLGPKHEAGAPTPPAANTAPAPSTTEASPPPH